MPGRREHPQRMRRHRLRHATESRDQGNVGNAVILKPFDGIVGVTRCAEDGRRVRLHRVVDPCRVGFLAREHVKQAREGREGVAAGLLGGRGDVREQRDDGSCVPRAEASGLEPFAMASNDTGCVRHLDRARREQH